MTAPTFWDNRAPSYAAKPIADLGAYEEMLREVRTLLDPNDRVLEIGCGTGGTAINLAPSVSSITATDSSIGMIRIARGKLGASAPSNVAFEMRDAVQPARETQFDAVLAFSLLHLIEDIPAVLASIRKQLRTGGLFVSKTVCLGDRSVWLRGLVRILTALGIAPRVNPVSRKELESLLESSGFKVLSVAYFDKRQMNPFLVAERVG